VAERLRREWRLEQMVVKMDTREAIKCLDAYTDSLISLSLLVGTSTLRNDSDLEMKGTRTGLQIMLIEKQKEAMELALAIVTAQNVRHRESIFDLSFFEMNEAVQRYVLADTRASEVLAPPQETYSEGMARIRRMVAARDDAAKEAKAEEAKKAREALEAKRIKEAPQIKAAEVVADAPTEIRSLARAHMEPAATLSTGTVHDAAAGNP
jgi:hypothetical protein